MLGSLIRGMERSGLNRNLGRRALRGKASSKQGPRNFYKGRGAKSLGKVDSKGRFRYDARKLPVLVVPDLTDCELKPYVAHNSPQVPKVAPPSVNDLFLDLQNSEVDILDIVAPQHKKIRAEKRKQLFKEIEQGQQQEGEEKPNVVVVE
eukprot:TRINITY_DN16228_c0_g1_i1.p1 TRINITY_DN16228_c0_g1~~TRINITY_DN16228_c0_g1_i1.p1  ORF type:complete len:149 (-),score=42.81 TRINITY_DN16228_c0_g1_i1:23-469(-)